jgi:hypothetical protein
MTGTTTPAAGTLREPLDLPQLDRNQCLSCVTAQILHMFDLDEGHQGISQRLRHVDQLLGRDRRQCARRVRVDLLLAQRGLSLRRVGEHDSGRLLAEGVDYLRWYYRDEWSEEWERHCTPEWLAQQREDCFQDRRVRAYPHVIDEHRRPNLGDVRRALDSGQVVVLALAVGQTAMCHTVLVHGHLGRAFELYEPQHRDTDTTLYSMSASHLRRLWLPSEGMTAIWR